ncbi:RHS repeat-associated core domain-containing protein [Aeromonas veronii]
MNGKNNSFPSDFSRRKFITNSVQLAIFSSIAISPLTAMAARFGSWVDDEDLLIIFKHEFLGLNGAMIDPVTGMYILGNGYRQYNPRIMRFLVPDSMSPFGQAGGNMYAYCHGDPINRFDPSGHLDGLKLGLGILSLLIGLAGAIAAPFTGGTSIAIAGSVIGGLLGAIGGALSVASAVVADTNPQAAARLDIAAFSFAIASVAASVTGAFGGAAQGLKSAASPWKVTYKLKPASVNTRMVKLWDKLLKTSKDMELELGSRRQIALASNVIKSGGARAIKESYRASPIKGMSWKVEISEAKGFKSNPWHFSKKIIGGVFKKDTFLNLSSSAITNIPKISAAKEILNELNNSESPSNVGTLGGVLSHSRNLSSSLVMTLHGFEQGDNGLDSKIRDGIF